MLGVFFGFICSICYFDLFVSYLMFDTCSVCHIWCKFANCYIILYDYISSLWTFKSILRPKNNLRTIFMYVFWFYVFYMLLMCHWRYCKVSLTSRNCDSCDINPNLSQQKSITLSFSPYHLLSFLPIFFYSLNFLPGLKRHLILHVQYVTG
jgi:hypothetical protein